MIQKTPIEMGKIIKTTAVLHNWLIDIDGEDEFDIGGHE